MAGKSYYTSSSGKTVSNVVKNTADTGNDEYTWAKNNGKANVDTATAINNAKATAKDTYNTKVAPKTETPVVAPTTTVTETPTTQVSPNPAVNTTDTADSNDNSYLREYIKSLQSYIDGLETKNEETLAAQKAAIQAGVDQSVNTLNNEKNTVNQSYEDTLRQLYLNKMNNQKNIAQKMAAMGQTGGQAESTLLGLNTAYDENLRQSEQAKSSALSELETAIANAKLSGSAEEANAIATNTQNGVSNYLSAMNNLIGSGTSVENLLNSIATNNQSTAYEKAMTLLSSGVMPDTTTLTSAGISTDEATKLLSAINAQKSASSASGTKTKTLTDTEKERLLNAYVNGDTSVLAEVEEAYGYPISTVLAMYGLTDDTKKVEGGSTSAGASPEYENVKAGAAQIQSEGRTGNARAYLREALFNALITKDEYDELLAKYGVH